VQPTVEPVDEWCLRCSAAMEWRHGTWQCPRCRFKLGCCEGVYAGSETKAPRNARAGAESSR
jgi:hypothetical protein